MSAWAEYRVSESYLPHLELVCGPVDSYANIAVQVQALLRTLAISGAYAAFETLLGVLYIFGFHVPLFLYAYGFLCHVYVISG